MHLNLGTQAQPGEVKRNKSPFGATDPPRAVGWPSFDQALFEPAPQWLQLWVGCDSAQTTQPACMEM